MMNSMNRLRLGGLNSGLDTEAIVRAMGAATRARINNNKRRVLMLQAQQNAYRDVISKLQNFQNTYFNVLNQNNFLRSSAIFNRTKASVFSTGTSGSEELRTPPGVTVSTAQGAKTGTYNVELISNATQAVLKGGDFGSDVKMDLSKIESRAGADPTDPNEQHSVYYAFSIMVGTNARNLVVDVKAGESGVDAINRVLLDTYGTSNTPGQGIVSIDDDGRVTATDRRSLAFSDIVKMGSTQDIAFEPLNLKDGVNSFNIQIGDTMYSVPSFNTLSSEFLTKLFDEHGAFLSKDDYVEAELGRIMGEIRDEAWENWNAANPDVDSDARVQMRDKAYGIWLESERVRLGDPDFEPVGGKDDWIAAMSDEEMFSIVHDDSVPKTGVGSADFYRLSAEADYDFRVNRYNLIATDLFMEITRPGYEAWDDNVDAADKRDLAFVWAVYDQGNRGSDRTNAWDEFLAVKSSDFADVQELIRAWETDDDLQEEFAEFIKDDDRYPEVIHFAVRDQFILTERAAFGAYREFIYPTEAGGMTYEDYRTSVLTADEATVHFNTSNFKNEIENLNLPAGMSIEVTFDKDIDGNIIGAKLEATQGTAKTPVNFAITSNKGTANDFDIDAWQLTAASVNVNSTLEDIGGFAFASNGTGSLTINGVRINVNSSMSVTEMMNAVNGSSAGVEMTFSTLTNSFTITAKDHGTAGRVEFGSDAFTSGFVSRLSLDTNPVTAGSNLVLDINGSVIETTSDSYTLDGTTFRFANHVENGTKFRVEVGMDRSAATDAIKNFVNDYNKLIEEIFGMTQERRATGGYHFLTDEDIEEFGMSDRQIEQWETMAKKGLLNNNSSILSVMSSMRTAMLTTVTGRDGKSFGIFNITGNAEFGRPGEIAIRPSTDYKKNGMLEFNEQALIDALERNPDDIINLFTGDNGIMATLQRELDRAIKTTGAPEQRGILIQRAGTATASATENALFERIKSLNDNIDILQARYERQQDRYWRIYSNMEKQFASLNNQSNFVMSMFGNMGQQ